MAFDELASFSGQSSLSDDFMVLPTTATVAASVLPLRARVPTTTTTAIATTEAVDGASLKAKRKTFIKSKKANKSTTTTTIVAAVDVHSFPSSVFVEDNFGDDPWLIYDLESYLDSKAAFSDKSHLAFFEDDSDIFY